MRFAGLTGRRSGLCLAFSVCLADFLASGASRLGERCVACHPRETAAYAQSAMAQSVSLPANQPGGSFEHPYSGTRFAAYQDSTGIHQSLVRNGEKAEQRVAYVIGSGNHALGYLVRTGDSLFQSPISYYTQSHSWGIAPGYELDPRPDFSRPVLVACLLCHSGTPDPIKGTLNRYQDPAFSAMGISCERCHGPGDRHIRRPVPGSIVNPAKLTGSRRDGVCEQCHLAGESRIPNPGKDFAGYRAGDSLEDTFTIYVRTQSPGGPIKVVSHFEQLALSACARKSSGRLWCGTCHNPHQITTRPADYFRARCLECHAATLDKRHAAENRNCVECHMPRSPASDGGHTVFTDHRIARHPSAQNVGGEAVDLKAWREPSPVFRERNLGLALADFATQKKSATGMIEAFRLLYRAEKDFPGDPAVHTALGSLLFIAQETQEAESHYRKAAALKPDFAPYQVNLGVALLKEGKKSEAKECLEKALQMDPQLELGVQALSRIYQELGEKKKADALLERYRRAMGYQQ